MDPDTLLMLQNYSLQNKNNPLNPYGDYSSLYAPKTPGLLGTIGGGLKTMGSSLLQSGQNDQQYAKAVAPPETAAHHSSAIPMDQYLRHGILPGVNPRIADLFFRGF